MIQDMSVIKKRILLTISPIVFAIITLPFTCRYMEEPHRHFDLYTKELHDGLWVPDIFPHDITDIHEQHNIDTNDIWLRFSLNSQTIDMSNFSSVQKSEITIKNPFYANWWFDQLPNHYKFYKGSYPIGTSVLARSTESNIVYWWCP